MLQKTVLVLRVSKGEEINTWQEKQL